MFEPEPETHPGPAVLLRTSPFLLFPEVGGVTPPSAGTDLPAGSSWPDTPLRSPSGPDVDLLKSFIQTQARRQGVVQGQPTGQRVASGPETQSIKCSHWSQPSFQKVPTQVGLCFLMSMLGSHSLLWLSVPPWEVLSWTGSSWSSLPLAQLSHFLFVNPDGGVAGTASWTSGAKSPWSTPWPLPLGAHEPSAHSWSPTH